MRKPPTWMTQTDERILEALRDHPCISCFDISKEGQESLIDAYADYIRRRCSVLENHNLLNQVGSDEYEVTKVAEKFLTGKIDLRDECYHSGRTKS